VRQARAGEPGAEQPRARRRQEGETAESQPDGPELSKTEAEAGESMEQAAASEREREREH
jgi:hypothetical protein